MKLSEYASSFASAHPVAAAVGVLTAEGVPLAVLATPGERITVLAVLAVGVALVVGQKFILTSLFQGFLQTGGSFDTSRNAFDRRLVAIELWRKAMDCDACAAKSADLERVARELAEVRALDPIAAALRTQTKPLPFR